MEGSLTLSFDTVNEPRIDRHDRFELSEPVERLEHASVSRILGTGASNVRALDLLKVACPLSPCLDSRAVVARLCVLYSISF
jgi:hypothetical protein